MFLCNAMPSLTSAFDRLKAVLEKIYRRQPNRQGVRVVSIPVARKFSMVDQEAEAIKSTLEVAEASSKRLQHTAQIAMEEGNVLMALTAINDLYDLNMEAIRPLERLNVSLDKILTKADRTMELELEGVNYKDELDVWKEAHLAWVNTTKDPIWAVEKRNKARMAVVDEEAVTDSSQTSSLCTD